MNINDFTYIKNKKKLGLLKEKKTLSLDIFKEGLFVFGTNDSFKHDYLLQLSKKYIDNGFNLVVLTESEVFSQSIALLESSENTQQINLLTYFNGEPILFNQKISLLTLDRKMESTYKNKAIRYFPELLQEVSKLDNTVIIIDDVLNENIYTDNLMQCLENFKQNDAGFIISSSYPSFYKDIFNSINNHVIFYLYDYPVELKDHPLIVKEIENISFFEKRELSYQYNLFTYYNTTTEFYIHDLKII